MFGSDLMDLVLCWRGLNTGFYDLIYIKFLGGLALRVYSIASVLGVLYWRSISLRATMFPVV
jgi:hypothetical protein